MNAILAFLTMGTVSATLRRIRGWFWPLSVEERLRAVVDENREAKRLKVEERARAEGQRNRPASDQAEPDANERAINEHFRALWIALCLAVGERFSDLIRQIGALEELFNPSVLDGCGSEAMDALGRLRAKCKLSLAKARAAEQAARRDLRSFCCENGLAREAHEARSTRALAASGLLVVLLEGAINTWAFVPGSDLGWLGGMIQAVVVAGVNIGPSYFAGVLARNLLHVSRLRKAAGVCTTLIFLFGYFPAYTLLVAHYRAALMVDTEQAAVQAVLRLIHTPFAIYDFHTWLLVICQALFSLGSFMTGFLAADPYPGYSREQANWMKRKTRVEAEESDYIRGIDAVTQPMLDAVDQRLTEACRARDTYREHVAEARSLVSDYDYSVRRLDSARAALVNRYRDVNHRIRDTPPPAYFADSTSELVKGSGTVSPAFDMSALEHAAEVMQNFSIDASDLRQKAAEVKRRIWELRANARSGSDVFFAEAEGLPEPHASTVPPVATATEAPAIATAPVIVGAVAPAVMPSARKRGGNGSDNATASPSYLGSS